MDITEFDMFLSSKHWNTVILISVKQPKDIFKQASPRPQHQPATNFDGIDGYPIGSIQCYGWTLFTTIHYVFSFILPLNLLLEGNLRAFCETKNVPIFHSSVLDSWKDNSLTQRFRVGVYGGQPNKSSQFPEKMPSELEVNLQDRAPSR